MVKQSLLKIATTNQNSLKIKAKTTYQFVVSFLLFIGLIMLFFHILFTYFPFYINYTHLVAQTNAMSPVIKKYDLITVNTAFNTDDLKEEDIIVFYINGSHNTKKILVRYIAKIETNEQNQRTFFTKTLAMIGTDLIDDWMLSEEQIIGKYVFCMPILSKFLLFTGSALGKCILFIDSIYMFFILKVIKIKES